MKNTTVAKLFCYHIAPIDFWDGALTASQLISNMGERVSTWEVYSVAHALHELEVRAQQAFRKIGWEGDVRTGPLFFALPGDNTMELGCMIKQDNNGSTFIASPHPLPWLAEGALYKSVDTEPAVY